jgi:RNA polymerase sigma-70 factor (ECF subfamily)
VTRQPEQDGAARPDSPSVHAQVERLFHEARDDVYYYILSFGLAAHEAQELAQDVFLRFYVALERGERIDSPRGWIFRAAHNLALNAIERAGTRRLFAVNSDRAQAAAPEQEERLIRKQAAERIREALGALSPKERLCLHLRAEGLRYAEIAKTTGVTLSTVSEFLTRAIRKLRKAVHE